MKKCARLVAPGLGLVIAACFAGPIQAQSAGYLTQSNLQGVVPGNTYQFGDIDQINLGNGGVNLNIPLFSVPGRKITDTSFFTYTSKFWIIQPNYDPINPTIVDSISWVPKPLAYGYIGGTPGAEIAFQEQNYYCEVRSQSIQQNVDSNFTVTDGTGAIYQFPNRHVWNSDGSNPNQWHCPGVNITDYDVTESSTGTLQLDTTNFPNYGIVTFKNGTRAFLPYWTTTPMYVEDSNGNFESFTGGDTLGRKWTGTYNYPTVSETIKDSNGNSATYSYKFANNGNLATSFPTASCNAAPFLQFNSGLEQTATLTLANGWTYTFTYDPDFGEVTKVILPSGGYIRYDYTTLAQADYGPQNLYCGLFDSRRVAHRYVSVTGSPSNEETWTYAYSGTNYQTTTVTDPNGNTTIHSFNTSTGLQEISTIYEEGSTPLKTIANTWASDFGLVQGNQSINPTEDYMNWRITQTTTTLDDTDQVSQIQTTYDSYTYTAPLGSLCANSCTASYSNPTEVRTYDYGNGSPGSLLQRTDFTYLYSNSTYANLHMMNQLTSKTVYDSTGNTCHGTSHPCSQTTYEYDNYTGGISSSGAVQHDSAFGTGYTTRGNVTATEVWRSTDGAWLTTRNQYDDAGNMVSSKDPNQIQGVQSGQTTYSYADSWGNTTCAPSGGNAAAYLTRTTNALGQIASATYNSCEGTVASKIDLNSQTTTYVYDGMDRVTQENYPDGGQTTYTYNDTSLPLSLSETQSISSGNNMVKTAIFDGLGRISQSQLSSDPAGTDYVDTTYDPMGHVASESNPHRSGSNPTDGVTSYIYDVLGRVCVTIPPDGTAVSGTACPSSQPNNDVFTSFSGNTMKVTDQTGRQRQTTSDAMGRMTKVLEDPAGLDYETDYSYDTLGNMLQVVQKGGTTNSAQWRTRTFAYDSLSHPLCANNPEMGTTACPIPDNGSYTSGTVRYSYDYDENVKSKVSPAPNQTNPSTTVTLNYWYDAMDRLLEKTSSDGTIGSYYLYDTANTNGVILQNPIGRLSRSNTTIVESLYSYDPMGRVIYDWQTTPMHNSMAFVLGYTYDFIGDMTSYTNGMGYQFNQTFDNASQLTKVTTNYSTSPSPVAQNFSYAPTGAMTGMNYGNNGIVAETRTYNNRLQTTEIWTYIVSSGYTIQGDWTSYQDGSSHNNGNMYGWTFYSNYNGGIVGQHSYTYDSLNRLSSLSSPADTSGCYGLQWTYDAWGNRTAQTTTPGTGGTCPDNFTASFSQNTNRMDDYSYDAAGNLLNDGSHSYTYDAENHIIKVDGGATATYSYDADGRRVETINSQGTMEKIYDLSGNVIADWLATGQMQGGWDVGYVYLGGRLAAVYEGSTTYFVGVDHLGSTRAMSDTSGNIVDAHDYLPFGEQLEGGSYTTHKFTGFERDSETGLDNARARYHASWMGRFLSLDPHNAGAIATSPQTWNAYVYVSNNPLTLTDPTGMIVSGDGDTNPNAGDGNTIFGDGHQNEPHVATEDGNQATGQQNPSPTAQNQSSEGTEANLERRAAIASAAEAHDGDTSMPYTPNHATCNLFVQKAIAESGAPKPVVTKKDGSQGAPSAAEWANGTVPGWRKLAPGEAPKPGDVAARKENFADATGHSGVVTGVSKSGVVTVTAAHATRIGVDMSFQPNSQQYNNVFMRYTGK